MTTHTEASKGYVYVLSAGDTNRTKIGRTKGSIADRIYQLQTGNPFVITERDHIATAYASKVESYLHALLAPVRGESGEWFEVAQVDLDQALEQARSYAAHLEATQETIESLVGVQVEDREEAASEQDHDLHLELLRLYAEHKRIEVEIERRESRLKLRIGSASHLETIASWKHVSGKRLDQTRLKEERPDLYEAFSKQINTRRFVVSRNRPSDPT